MKLLKMNNKHGIQCLYRVPDHVTADQFMEEFERFDFQSDFDEENMVGAERVRPKPGNNINKKLWYPRKVRR